MCAHKQCISIPQGTLTTRKSTSDIICRVSQTPPDRSPLAYALAESLSCSPCRCQGPLFLTVCHLKPALSLFTSSLNTSELLQPGRHRFVHLLAAPPPRPRTPCQCSFGARAVAQAAPAHSLEMLLWHWCGQMPPLRTPCSWPFVTGAGRCSSPPARFWLLRRWCGLSRTPCICPFVAGAGRWFATHITRIFKNMQQPMLASHSPRLN
jgi:hypothetical protein